MTAALVEAAQTPFAQTEAEDHLTRAPAAGTAERHTSPRLNLPLAKLLAEAHGGTLAIDSRPGAGTTVAVRLPLAEASAGAAPKADRRAPSCRPAAALGLSGGG
jgi:light-regulated signal transduction histidine kinase (bacteriophytochrome)